MCSARRGRWTFRHDDRAMTVTWDCCSKSLSSSPPLASRRRFWKLFELGVSQHCRNPTEVSAGVASDVFRRLAATTMAQQLGLEIERATSPFQYALSTRAGTECIAHAIQALTDLNPDATVLSIDGIGAFDMVSRQAMLQGLQTVVGGDAALPFVRQFLRVSIDLFVGRPRRHCSHHHASRRWRARRPTNAGIVCLGTTSRPSGSAGPAPR